LQLVYIIDILTIVLYQLPLYENNSKNSPSSLTPVMLQALQWVAIQGYIGIVYWLLWAGANANERRAYFRGGAALESAAEHGRVDMLQLLLEAGVLIQDPGRRKNIRPVSLAERNGHLAASRLLKSHDGWTKEGAILAEKGVYDIRGSPDFENDLVGGTYKMGMESPWRAPTEALS
jgi:hypothetical protein